MGLNKMETTIKLTEEQKCKHFMLRNPSEHQENKCRLCNKPFKKSK